MKEYLKNIIATVSDTMFDESLTCNICGKEVFYGELFCQACEENFTPIGADFCNKCGRRTVSPRDVCEDCRDYEVDKARSAFVYKGSAAKLIRKFKYHSAKYLDDVLAERLFTLYIENNLLADVITFVPMLEKQEYERGYNHVRVLAEKLGELTGIQVIPLLTKEFETINQVGLSREERKKNLKGSFKIIDKSLVKGKKILLIDDVLTTGATSGEIAFVLKKARAESVYLLTVASVSKVYDKEEAEEN